MMAAKALVGYTDRLSVVAGDRQRFMISAPGRCRASLVHIICGEAGERFAEQPVTWAPTGEYDGYSRTIRPGSWGEVAKLPHLKEYTFSAWFMPTLLTAELATLVDVPNYGITIMVGEKGLWTYGRVGSPFPQRHSNTWTVITAAMVIGERLLEPLPLAAHRWHWLSLRYREQQMEMTLHRLPGNSGERASTWSSKAATRQKQTLMSGSWLFGVRAGCDSEQNLVLERFYDGRLELPWIANQSIEPAEALELSRNPDELRSDPRVVAAWDFSAEIGSDRFVDLASSQCHGQFYNTPTRAVRGASWDGSEQDWKRAPRHYAAVHFHSDDLTDAEWNPSIEWTVPEELASGSYAVKLNCGDEEDYVPFFVRPSPRHAKSPVAFLVPTASYLAYANVRLSMHAALRGLEPMTETDAYLHEHPEVGSSLYERHADDSGVHYSSYLRPVANLKPKGRLWAYTADTNITAWLHHCGMPFDVVTDEDLHREGAALLAPYSVVVTGTHPEYASTAMLDALESYLTRGGRLMYMGGNGFYWRVAWHPRGLPIIELRRTEMRGLAWDSPPGEYYHSFSGEYGGLWRQLGRPPNRLTGVGFVALANHGSTGYRRRPGAEDPRARFIFDGTTEGTAFGAYGSVHCGAVSQEIDRCNPLLGSPPHTLVLASSENHPDDFALVAEEARARYPESQGPKLRADMTYFETPAGGAVFATGSIGFAGALAHQGYANHVCRIATNVLRRFCDPTPIAYPASAAS